MTKDVYYLPEDEHSDVTPELVAELLKRMPPHQEGDVTITVTTDSLQDLLEAMGHTVIRGYHQKAEGDS